MSKKSKLVNCRAIKEAVTMENVLSHYGLLENMKRSGDNLSGCCPIHKGTNPTQFRVSVSKNLWNCFSECKRGGNVVDLIARMEDVSPYAAALKAIEWFKLDPERVYSDSDRTAEKPKERRESKEPVPPATPDAKPAPPPEAKPEGNAPNPPLKFRLDKLQREHPYLIERGLTLETLVDFGTGYCEKGMMAGRIAIPIHNVEWDVRRSGYSKAFPDLAREFRQAMGSIANGQAVHGGIIPFTATFFTFSDYMRPPIRLAALMEQGVIFVFTHDSIALGEDGSTHQPIERLASLRAIPNLLVIRPCDANETAVAWRVAIERRNQPVALALTRQDVPTLDCSQFASPDGLRRDAYILADSPPATPCLIMIASGSEVGLIAAAAQKLCEQEIPVRLISMASWELFEAQSPEYRDSVLPPSVHARLAVGAGVTQGWHRYVGDRGDVIGVDRFGASAPGPVVMREYGFSVENVCQRALALLEREHD